MDLIRDVLGIFDSKGYLQGLGIGIGGVGFAIMLGLLLNRTITFEVGMAYFGVGLLILALTLLSSGYSKKKEG